MTQVLFALFISIFTALPSFARGPSVSGGTSEAPWVRTQDVTLQVVKYANENSLAIQSIQFDKAQMKVLLKTSCDNGKTGHVLFGIVDDCRQTPVMCLPVRNLVIEETVSCN